MVIHLASLVAGFIVPLILWLVKRDESAFIDAHGKEAMNWNISLIIYSIVSFVLVLVLVGIFLLLALMLADVVFSILAAVAANKGEYYRYPMAIRFIR